MDKFNSKNYCFIIPTYNPNKNFKDVIKKLSKLKAQIFLFDNNSKDKKYLENIRDIEIEYSNQNYGYGYGINFFIKKYYNKFEWFGMLDQDSLLNEKYINFINEKFNFDENNVGLIGTNVKYRNLNKKLINLDLKKDFHRKKTLICSGTFINKSLIEKFGYLKESFFMEYIDVEYCLRLEKSGYSNFITSYPFLNQKFGNNQKKYFFGRLLNIDNHNPERYFYRSHNLKYCIKFYLFHETAEVLLHIFNFFKMYLKIILFENFKLKKTYLIFKGFIKKL